MSSWFFPKLGGGEEQGLNDAGVQQFKREKSLGRETCQNIGDVRDESGKPAIATFELVHLPADEFPGRDQFIKIFESCRDYVLEGLPDGTGNEKKFFELGLDVLNRETIPVLRIGDENTTGLIGADDERSQSFYRLLKLQGASSAQGVGGGTYGIGQRAPFAHSSLRTVFYSTKTPNGKAFIAKSVLASFPSPIDGEITQSKGWWCNANSNGGSWSTIRNDSEIPERFHREQIGTDLWVTGFLSENWEQFVRHSILQHFFAAIENGQFILQLMVDGEIQTRISADNLEDELLKAADEAKSQQSRSEFNRGLGSTIYFHKALKYPYDGAPFEKEITKIGKVKLYLYRDTKNKDMPDRWATMRKPKIIVEHFGSGLLSNFAAVLLCDNNDGNNYLAQLENSTHERWSEQETRNWTSAEKNEASRVLNEIKKFVRETLKEVRGDDMKEQQDIPFLGRYLPAEDDDMGEQSVESAADFSARSTEEETGERRTRDDTAPVTGVARRHDRPTVSTEQPVETGQEWSVNPTPTPNPEPPNPNPNPVVPTPQPITPVDDSENAALSPNLVRFRSFRVDNGYRVVLQANEDLIGNLNIRAVGEDSNYFIDIVSAVNEDTGDELKINKSLIANLNLPAGEKVNLLLNIDTDMDLCLAMGNK